MNEITVFNGDHILNHGGTAGPRHELRVDGELVGIVQVVRNETEPNGFHRVELRISGVTVQNDDGALTRVTNVVLAANDILSTAAAPTRRV